MRISLKKPTIPPLFERWMYAWLLGVALGTQATMSQGAEYGPHEFSILYTPLVQRAVRSSETNANAELDLIGRFRLSQGGNGVWGQTHLSFWALGNHTIGGTLSNSEFSRASGLLWDSNDGDAPDPDWLLGIFALQQEFTTKGSAGTLEFGKLYPGLTLASLPYAGDDRDSFMSQIISSDAAGRWFDRIGLGARVSVDQGRWFASALISDATAEKRLFDFDTLGDGSNLYAIEMGLTPKIAGRATKMSMVPYVISSSSDLSRETGLVLNGLHDLRADGSVALFGRYTVRTGGEPQNNDARDDARPLKRGGFLGVAFDRPFGRDDRQIAVAVMQGSASDTAVSNGLGSQTGVETFWKADLGRYAEFTAGLQVVDRGSTGWEYIPGLRLKLEY